MIIYYTTGLTYLSSLLISSPQSSLSSMHFVQGGVWTKVRSVRNEGFVRTQKIAQWRPGGWACYSVSIIFDAIQSGRTLWLRELLLMTKYEFTTMTLIAKNNVNSGLTAVHLVPKYFRSSLWLAKSWQLYFGMPRASCLFPATWLNYFFRVLLRCFVCCYCGIAVFASIM